MTNPCVDMNNPMLAYYADQAAQHAARNPVDQAAQQQASYWANLAAQQRQMFAHAASQPTSGPMQQPRPASMAPPAPPGIPAPVPSQFPGAPTLGAPLGVNSVVSEGAALLAPIAP